MSKRNSKLGELAQEILNACIEGEGVIEFIWPLSGPFISPLD